MSLELCKSRLVTKYFWQYSVFSVHDDIFNLPVSPNQRSKITVHINNSINYQKELFITTEKLEQDDVELITWKINHILVNGQNR